MRKKIIRVCIISANTAVRLGLTTILEKAAFRVRTVSGPSSVSPAKVDLVIVDTGSHTGLDGKWKQQMLHLAKRIPTLGYGADCAGCVWHSVPLTAGPRDIIRAATQCRNMPSSQTRDRHKNPTAPKFTRREREVYELLGLGRRNRHIARALDISVKTVETHKEHLKRKLDLSSTADLMEHAIRAKTPDFDE